jgi:hypothetical protein
MYVGEERQKVSMIVRGYAIAGEARQLRIPKKLPDALIPIGT